MNSFENSMKRAFDYCLDAAKDHTGFMCMLNILEPLHSAEKMGMTQGLIKSAKSGVLSRRFSNENE